MYAVGGLMGAMLVGPLAGKFGRHDAMPGINITFVIGAALLSTATTSTQFAIGRNMVGIGSGSMAAAVSMCIAEISPPAWRGALGSLILLASVFRHQPVDVSFAFNDLLSSMGSNITNRNMTGTRVRKWIWRQKRHMLVMCHPPSTYPCGR